MDHRAITLQRMQVFCAVYEHGSFSAAARALSISQPTVSKHLRDLERALGMTLFVLDHGRITPSNEAGWLYHQSKFLSEGVRELSKRITRFRSGAERQLSVGCVGMLTRHHLPQAVARIMEQMPDLNLNLWVQTAIEQLSAIRAGQIDLGICVGMVDCADLHAVRIGQGKLVLMAPKETAAAARMHVTPQDIVDHGVGIDVPFDRPLGKLFHNWLDGRAPSQAAGRIVAYSLQLMVPLAQQLRRSVVIDSFSASAIMEDDMQLVDLHPEVTFDVLAISARPLDQLGPARDLTQALQHMLAGTGCGTRQQE
ncbi:LysR family transcriptional regulator [Roseinatronobacter sp.]|uniref:LysR family transcriptional regulator n=2 Tax=Roseinatronobacter sp. TaxID=1945755 RepID=UPI003F6F58AC